MNRHKGRWLAGVILLVLLLICILSAGQPAQAQNAQPEVVVLEATGAVSPPMQSYIERGLAEADSRNAEAVVLLLDTPGGGVTTMFEIVQDIRNSDVPVIVYVGPRGAKAGSAGLLITIAGHVTAMAPETVIGASSVIGTGGEEVDSTAKRKEEEAIAAQGRGLVEDRGEAAVQLVEDAIFEARAVSATEAKEANLIDFIAENINDLLRQADGTEVEVNGRMRTLNTSNVMLHSIPMNQIERALIIITDPNIVFLLLSIGMTAIIVEIRSPGGWIAGFVGVSALGLSLYGLGVLPVNWLGIVFVIMAFVLFVLEVKAPVHGALTAAGLISLVVGAIILFNQPEIAPFGQLSIPLVVAQSLILAGIFTFMVYMALRAQSLQPTTGYEGLVGQAGRVTQALSPTGMVQVWGERWQARSENDEMIPAGTEIEVVKAGKMRLLVRRTESASRGIKGE